MYEKEDIQRIGPVQSGRQCDKLTPTLELART